MPADVDGVARLGRGRGVGRRVGRVLTTSDGHLEAFDAGGCGQATCNALTSIAVGNPVKTAPAVGSGRVFVTDTMGTVHAYGLPS